jgi:hypothetical protein
MGVRSLAAGRTKFTILTTEPADPENPTATELNAGIQADEFIMKNDFLWGATDSEKIDEPTLRQKNKSNALGEGNYQGGATFFRYWKTAGGADTGTGGEDLAFQAVKAKGTTLWGYARHTDKDAEEPWAATDEIYLGAEFTTDEPQRPSDVAGYTKWRVPFEIQEAYPWIAVAGS